MHPANCTVHRAADAATLARDLAEFVAERLREGVARRGTALLVLSGGSTPVPFFEHLSTLELPWLQVQVTLADERWVPPDHADSNERLIRRHLLKGPAAQAGWCPLFNAAATPAEGLAATEEALRQLPWPADVMVLGMGGDGHTASLFPHDSGLARALDPSAQAPRCLAVDAPERPNVPVARLSLSRRGLLDARCLVLHITGADKWTLLQKAMAPGAVEDLPVRLALHQQAVPCHVFHAD